MRKIIHVDMDAFYASVEQRDHPELRGKPVIVGGKPGSRGVVAACSYEARRFGIHSAMPASTALHRCPEALFVAPRFEVYRRVSEQIHQIFREFTAMVEPLSLDEAFLDVSSTTRWQGSATLIAQEIKTRIKMATGLTASAGVSYNKFLAKIASDVNKPDGLFVITPEQSEEFIAQLPVGRFFGVGKVTERKMHALGLKTGADIRAWSESSLIEHFGKMGMFFYLIARGIDDRPVSARKRKSISKEITFPEDINGREQMFPVLLELAEKVSDNLIRKHLAAGVLMVKIKYADFRQVTRRQVLTQPTQSIHTLHAEINGLLDRTGTDRMPVRLLGIGVARLVSAESIIETNDQITLL